MQGKTIGTIYFYIISAAALALIVIGIFNGVNFLINSTQFEKYPLRYGAISNCEFLGEGPYGAPYSVRIAPSTEDASPTAEQLEKNKKECLKNDEIDRRQHKVDDIKNSVMFTLVGAILFLIHFPKARKFSKD